MPLLAGALDVHVHGTPDAVERRQASGDVAADALEAGMAGVVLKNHVTPTVGTAAAVNDALGEEVLYGGVVLNGSVGGINPPAVEAALALGGRVVWLPTVWSEADATRIGEGDGSHPLAALAPDPADAISPVHDGELVPECRRVIELVASHDAALVTGHVDLEATRLVVDACREAGASCLVNHPFARYLDGGVEVHEELADRGAVLEYCALTLTHDAGVTPADVAAAVDRIGPDRCLLASDFGQVRNPPPVEGFGGFLRDVVEAGVPEDSVRRMVTEVPARVLGIG